MDSTGDILAKKCDVQILELHFDRDKVNVNGGAIVHGHPIAATGAMLVTKLAYEMKRCRVKRGLVTACLISGEVRGIALLLERWCHFREQLYKSKQ